MGMFTKITLAKHIRIGARNMRSIADVKISSSLQYFDDLLSTSNGPFLRGHRLSYVDVGLLGQFQCILCGLSDEVLPMVDNYPALWEWLQAMHRLPALMGYQRMYPRRTHKQVHVFPQSLKRMHFCKAAHARSSCSGWAQLAWLH